MYDELNDQIILFSSMGTAINITNPENVLAITTMVAGLDVI